MTNFQLVLLMFSLVFIVGGILPVIANLTGNTDGHG